jgi:DNA repair protein RadA/Sms
LVGGEPGVGKSTLLLEVASRAAANGKTVLYLTAEESLGQVAARGRRIGATDQGLMLAATNQLQAVKALIAEARPQLLVVDSIQALTADGQDGVPGGVTQVKAVTATLVAAAKACDMTCLLVGHVTKDGSVAGPRTVEHLVDAVLLFEGDRHSSLRWLRASKNRFGSAEEVGCFEMAEDGIRPVDDPSGLFLDQALGLLPGSSNSITLEGRRPLAVGLQSLVLPNEHGAKRTTSGIDSSRLAMLLAVLEKHSRLRFSKTEVYAATVGGLRCVDPAIDLALALACVSALDDSVAPVPLVALGEIGLGGQIRPVKALAKRLAEAKRLGFKMALVPPSSPGDCISAPLGIELVEVADVSAALSVLQCPATKLHRMVGRQLAVG